MHVAEAIVIVPVAGWVHEFWQGFGALLHEQTGDGPVGFALMQGMREEDTVNDFVSLRVTD